MLPPADESVLPVPESAGPSADAPAGLFGRLYWWLSLAVVAFDQLAKAIVNWKMAVFDSVTIIPGLVDLTHVQNKGVAFGLLNDAPMNLRVKAAVTTVLAVLALAGISLYARHIRPEERLARAGLSLILGGAIGNLLDRLTRGFVIDFVDVYWRGWHFWAFNVADAAISVGVALMVVEMLGMGRYYRVSRTV